MAQLSHYETEPCEPLAVFGIEVSGVYTKETVFGEYWSIRWENHRFPFAGFIERSPNNVRIGLCIQGDQPWSVRRLPTETSNLEASKALNAWAKEKLVEASWFMSEGS